MRRGSRSMRVVSGMAMAFLIAIAAFGLILTLLWLPRVGWPYYTLLAGLVAYALSIAVGGLVAGALVGSRHIMYGALFGLGFGLVSSWYVLGPMLLVLLIAPATALSGALGGVLCMTLARRGQNRQPPAATS